MAKATARHARPTGPQAAGLAMTAPGRAVSGRTLRMSGRRVSSLRLNSLRVSALLLALLVLATGCSDEGPQDQAGTTTSTSTGPDGTATGDGAAAGEGAAAGGGAAADQPPGTGAGAADLASFHDQTVAIGGVGGLPEGLARAVDRDPEVLATSVIRGATLPLVATRRATGTVVDELPEDWWFPVEVLAFDPDRHAAVVGPTAIDDLGPGEAVLSASSAQVRNLTPGDVLEFADGTELTVTAVVDDELVAAAEVAVSIHGDLDVPTARALLARTSDADVAAGWADLDRLAAFDPDGELQDAALSAVRGDEVPVLRHAAGVLSPVRLKVHYGEFAISDGPGRWVRQGASWLRAHHTITDVPLLGEVECHDAAIEPLTAAMTEIVERGMSGLVDGDDFGGCWAPRTSGSGAPSSHAWGIAVDLNVQGNHYGFEPTIAPEVVEVMERHGFAWGGRWPVPDGMHFELVPDHPLPGRIHG